MLYATLAHRRHTATRGTPATVAHRKVRHENTAAAPMQPPTPALRYAPHDQFHRNKEMPCRPTRKPSDKETIAFILDQLASLPVRIRAMFGGHALYCDEKVVALIGDNTLDVKPTPAIATHLPDAELAPPYPGAKDYAVVPGDRIEDGAWFRALIEESAIALPLPKPRRQKSRQSP